MFDFRIFKSTTVRTVEPALRQAFNRGEIASMAGLGEVVRVSSGDDLMTEGTAGTHAFFITAGSATVTRNDGVVAEVRKGDLVGERALITGDTRNATVTARMPITALRFDAQEFARLRSELPKVNSLSHDLVAARD